MSRFEILYDEPQEAYWFRSLHPDLADAREASITSARDRPEVQKVLFYDRPDVVLLDNGHPILVVEETVEVPSGHNVGQRFARIAAAAECGVPCLYFGPYVAKKHGGDTAGPRYMNLRLFHALDAMERATGAAVTTVNWPVDHQCEVRRDPHKDDDVRAYMATFFDSYYRAANLADLNRALIGSEFHEKMVSERQDFAQSQIRSPEQYDGPPPSVEIFSRHALLPRFGYVDDINCLKGEVVLYNIGMRNIRSDPYTGMSILYHYLYVAEYATRDLVLWFPHISHDTWQTVTSGRERKDIRLFRVAADAILFSNSLVPKASL